MSKIKFTFISLIVLLCLIWVTTILHKPVESAPRLQKESSQILKAADFFVDSTEDLKALGYPDSRKIVRDSKGNLYIAYRKVYRTENSSQRIFVAKSTDDGISWSVLNEDEPIETVHAYVQRVPSLAIDEHDTLHVVWYGLDESTPGHDERQIKYTRSTDGGLTWTIWRNIAPVAGYRGTALWQEHPTIYVDMKNVIYVVWQGGDMNHSQIKFIKSVDGGESWSAWRNINDAPTTSYSRPVLVTNHAASVLYVVAYRNFPGQPQIVWTRSRDGGATWAPWSLVAPDDQDQRHVSAAIDSHDRLHIVWRQIPNGAQNTAQSSPKVQVHYAMFDGVKWTKPTLPATQPDQYQFFPSITIDANDQPWLVWTATTEQSDYPREETNTGLIYYTTQVKGKWQTAIRLTNTTSTYASLIREVSTVNPTVDVVWLENRSSSEGLICYYTLDRAFNKIYTKRSGACEVAAPDTPSVTPLPPGTPTKTPKPTSEVGSFPNKRPAP